MFSVTARRPAVSLSPRELEVLELLRAGLGQKEVAARLELSVWTVKTYIERARRRSGARSTAHLLAVVARARPRTREEPRTT